MLMRLALRSSPSASSAAAAAAAASHLAPLLPSTTANSEIKKRTANEFSDVISKERREERAEEGGEIT
jgi:hypothetical protein